MKSRVLQIVVAMFSVLVVSALSGCSVQLREPTPTLAPEPTPTPAPTNTPSVPKPVAGVWFEGTFDGGTVKFKIAEDGMSITEWWIVIMDQATCAEGHTVGDILVYVSYNSSIPIQNATFDDSTPDSEFGGEFGTEVVGQFDTATTASGNLRHVASIDVGPGPPDPCTIGPVEWIASAE